VIPPRLALTAGGYLLAAGLFWLWLGARDDLAQAIAQCNADKQTAIAEAEAVARASADAAYAQRIAQLEERNRRIMNALEAAREEAELAMARPAETRRIIERVVDTDACLSAPVPADIRDSLLD
jgi:hypothetical protein